MSASAHAFVRQSGLVRKSDFNFVSEMRCPTLIGAAEQDMIRSFDEAVEVIIGIQNSQFEIVRGLVT